MAVSGVRLPCAHQLEVTSLRGHFALGRPFSDVGERGENSPPALFLFETVARGENPPPPHPCGRGIQYILYICGFPRIHALTRIQNILFIKKPQPGLRFK